MAYGQVLRWLCKRGAAVHKLKLFLAAGDQAVAWPSGAADLLALLPNLKALKLYDTSSFFRAADDVKFLAQLTSLTRLKLTFGIHELAFAQPTTSEPLCHLASLQSLTLNLHTYDRDAAIQLSEHLTKLTCLTHLAVSGRYDHNVAELIPQLTSLQSLGLGCHLDQVPTSFAKLCHLQSLGLSSFQRYGPAFSIPEALSSCQGLSSITLSEPSRNTLDEWSRFCRSFLCLPALRELRISNIPLTYVPDGDWCFHPQLQSLSLAYCDIETCPTALRSLTGLTNLDICSNWLSELPAGPYLKNLVELEISGNEGLADLSCLAASTCLQTLTLGETTQVDSSALAAVLPLACTIDLLDGGILTVTMKCD